MEPNDVSAPEVDLERAAQAISQFLAALGHPETSDPELNGTGKRVAHAYYEDLLCGYRLRPGDILADRMPAHDQNQVIVTNIATTCMCPHHLLPATGLVTIGYVPSEHIVGLGALDQLVQCYARRLTLQEDIGRNTASALVTHLGAKSAGCAVHMAQSCMMTRGGKQTQARVLTTAFAGAEDAEFRLALLSQLPAHQERA